MPRSQKKNFIGLHYDKLIVVAVLIGLVFSLGSLIKLARNQRNNEQQFNNRVEGLVPEHPETARLDARHFEATLEAIEHPEPVRAAGLLVAAERVACIQCGWPIRLDARICMYCNAQQPTDEVSDDWDSDGDGMPDAWEKKYGLNPLDPTDAAGDLDGDGFTNLEEYLAGTDPTDPLSRPPLIDYLRAEKIDAIRFPFVLKAKAMGRFQLNELTSGQTYFARLNEPVGRSGFRPIAFTNRMERVVTPGIGERMRDLTVLTLSNDEEEVELVEDGGPVWNSFEVTLVCDRGPKIEPIVVKQRGTFTFDGTRYTVLRLARRDSAGDAAVIIRDENTQQEIRIPAS